MQKAVLLFGALSLLWVGCQINHPPDKPHSPTPTNGATNIPDSITLNWQCDDVDGDSLGYTLYFGIDSVPPLKAESLGAGSFLLTGLASGTTYYWRVEARDQAGATSESPVWHFTTVAPSGAIRISSYPAGACIYIDRVYTGLVTDTVIGCVPVGTHEVKLCRDGYCDCVDSVQVVEKDTAQVSKLLVQAGIVKIVSTPAGARVLVDGSETGFTTNCTLPKVPVGVRTVTLVKTGYQDWTQTVTVVPSGTVFVSARLVACYGSIQISSTPDQAEIWLDGQKTGNKTNCVLANVLVGDHTIVIKHAGYQDWNRTVRVSEGTTSGVDADLVGLGFLSVQSTPTGAEVALDGQKLGFVTPTLLSNVTEGSHTLTLKLQDYRTFTQGVVVAAAETTSVTGLLKHETGRIQVGSTPAAAQVALDGIATGRATPCALDTVWTGRHRLDLTLAGKFPFSTLVDVVVDQTVRIDTMLLPHEIGSFTGAAGASRVCVAGGYAVIANGNGGVVVVDVSNPVAPRQVGALSVGDVVQALAVAGKYAYLGTWGSGFKVVDLTRPNAPAVVGALVDSSSLPGGAIQGIAVVGTHVYVVDKRGNFRIIDVANPSRPVEVGSYQTGGTGEGVVVVDRYAYIADGANGLVILDVAVPTDPKPVGQSTGTIYAIDVRVSGSTAYVCDWKTGVVSFDLSSKILPKPVGTFRSLGSAEGLTLAGGCVCLADGIAGLRVLDCQVPAALCETGWEMTPGSASGVCVSGPLAFVADGQCGMRVIRIGW